MEKPKNIFETILAGLAVTNENIVDLSKEIAAIREELAIIHETIIPSLNPANEETDIKPAKK